VERFKFIKSEKMMRKDVSGGQRSKFKKSEKNDEKRRFRGWKGFKFIKSEKMKKTFQEVERVQVHKIRKNDEKRRFRRSKVKVQKIRKK
jgi:hypothetical protein